MFSDTMTCGLEIRERSIPSRIPIVCTKTWKPTSSPKTFRLGTSTTGRRHRFWGYVRSRTLELRIRSRPDQHLKIAKLGSVVDAQLIPHPIPETLHPIRFQVT